MHRQNSLYLVLGLMLLFLGVNTLPQTGTASSIGDLAKLSKSDKDKELLFGGCDYDPFQKLQQMKVIQSGVKIVPRKEGSSWKDGIDSSLACRLTKLIEFAQQNNCQPRITSGYRDPNDQRRACMQVCGNPNGCSRGCAAPGASCHQYGLAVDMPSNCRDLLKRNAPKFRLRAGTAGYPNPIHFQCIEHVGANRAQCPKECDGGNPIDPGAALDLSPSGSGSPSSGLTNSFRNLLGGGQQSPQSQPAAQPQPAPQPQPIPQQQGSIQQNQLFPQDTKAVPIGTAATGSSSITKPDPLDHAQASYSSPVGDKLLELAYGTPLDATSTATSSIPLYIDPSDVSEIHSDQNPSSASGTAAYTESSLQPTNTFVSPDLSANAPEVAVSFRGEATGFEALLMRLRDALGRLLEILRPMGISDALRPLEDNLNAE